MKQILDSKQDLIKIGEEREFDLSVFSDTLRVHVKLVPQEDNKRSESSLHMSNGKGTIVMPIKEDMNSSFKDPLVIAHIKNLPIYFLVSAEKIIGDRSVRNVKLLVYMEYGNN